MLDKAKKICYNKRVIRNYKKNILKKEMRYVLWKTHRTQ